MKYHCCSDDRRNAVKNHPFLNGIDFLEVLDNPEDAIPLRQTTLYVHFLKPLSIGSLSKTNIKIEGGQRIKKILVTDAKTSVVTSPLSSPFESNDKILELHVSRAGDFSIYNLSLIKDPDHAEPPSGFDPVLSTIDFSFKVLCNSDFDCKNDEPCESKEKQLPDINYLAKDYSSFRSVLLDRMNFLLPGWKEKSPADAGIALIELLAYTGDYLSYQQDAIATEAYLNTCRKRVSARRHARLVDYNINDGCNARCWVQISITDDLNGYILRKGDDENRVKVVSKTPDLPSAFSLTSAEFEKSLFAGAKVFELMEDIVLYSKHNRIPFYTWAEEDCCLPKGAVCASLAGDFSNLAPGNILILAEMLGPQTGAAQDADPFHRHPVRLISVTLSYDPLFDSLSSPLESPPLLHRQAVTEITWDKEDALPFSLRISSRSAMNGYLSDVSVALGNIVLADHGLTMNDLQKSSLIPDIVPLGNIASATTNKGHCKPEESHVLRSRYRPRLKYGPLTFAMPYQETDALVSAYSLSNPIKGISKPEIKLMELYNPDLPTINAIWNPQYDLLSSSSVSNEFVVEMESDGIAHLRFGDGILGSRPKEGSKFLATYRIGNGLTGHIGAHTLAHLVINDSAILNNTSAISITNPLSSTGAKEPERMDEIKLKAPKSFKKQERAVLASDYEEVAKRCDPDIQQSAVTFRWTGSWRTAFLTVDRMAGLDVDWNYETELRRSLEKYRMAGMDLEVAGPLYVSLEIEMEVCVLNSYFPFDVKLALLQIFSNKRLQNGIKGLFHPDNFTFGQTVYLSSIYAAAHAVQGVESVRITKFRRQGEPLTNALESGKINIGRLEIARLDNDSNFPERGFINLIMKGENK